MLFEEDERGVAPIIAFVFILFFVVAGIAVNQAEVVPQENERIEADHYEEIQDDLSSVRAAVVSAAESGETRETTVQLGTRYPSRIVALSPAPPAGSFETTSVGSGAFEETDGNLDLNGICRVNGGAADSVSTNALVYRPGYNYFTGGDFEHRIEGTLFYQNAESGELVRTDQTMVDPGARSVTLYPVRADISENGVDSKVISFTGGYGRTTTASGVTLTIPTQASVSTWEEQVATGNPDVSVAAGAADDTVDITFTGDWFFRCKPVGGADAPDQLLTADAGPDRAVNEGNQITLDGSGSQPSSRITSYSWTITGPNPGATLIDSDTARPTFDASGVDVSSNTDVTVELTVDDAGSLPSNTDTTTVTIRDTSSSSGSAPTVNIQSASESGGQIEVTFDASDPDNDISSYTVEFYDSSSTSTKVCNDATDNNYDGSSTTESCNPGTGGNPSGSSPYYVVVSVTDDAGNTGTAESST